MIQYQHKIHLLDWLDAQFKLGMRVDQGRLLLAL